MIEIVGVQFKKAGKIYYFQVEEDVLKRGDRVLVETERGQELGYVVVDPKIYNREDEMPLKPTKKIIRKASDKDIEQWKQNKAEAIKALKVFREKIEEHKLPMKPVTCEVLFDRCKYVFYFRADNRVDFRELVKDLAKVFKRRIELRQIGVRDEAKMLRGLGCCGVRLCCAENLREFCPVSIRAAKEQNLSLNPLKISGLCGRLMCCLMYELSPELQAEIRREGRDEEIPEKQSADQQTAQTILT
ncbi:MAG: regulatory iron-sulfur-containing complex subunit RicT [Candidatus Hydrogenedentota bacterium]